MFRWFSRALTTLLKSEVHSSTLADLIQALALLCVCLLEAPDLERYC